MPHFARDLVEGEGAARDRACLRAVLGPARRPTPVLAERFGRPLPAVDRTAARSASASAPQPAAPARVPSAA